jgi:hypothetical protein
LHLRCVGTNMFLSLCDTQDLVSKSNKPSFADYGTDILSVRTFLKLGGDTSGGTLPSSVHPLVTGLLMCSSQPAACG